MRCEHGGKTEGIAVRQRGIQRVRGVPGAVRDRAYQPRRGAAPGKIRRRDDKRHGLPGGLLGDRPDSAPLRSAYPCREAPWAVLHGAEVQPPGGAVRGVPGVRDADGAQREPHSGYRDSELRDGDGGSALADNVDTRGVRTDRGKHRAPPGEQHHRRRAPDTP